MASTHYLILQLETLEDGGPDVVGARTAFRQLGDIHSYSAARACEEYARTQLHEAMLMENGVTLIAVPARAWTSVKIRASQQLKLETEVEGHDDG
jgi:hypothetical protein